VQLCRLWASLGRRYRAKGFWSNERSRLNAIRHGILSRHLVLPWEDRSEYDDLLESLVTEHRPNGPTEHHLVEELAGVISPPVSARWPQNSFTKCFSFLAARKPVEELEKPAPGDRRRPRSGPGSERG
jgi:hypothetical protein